MTSKTFHGPATARRRLAVLTIAGCLAAIAALAPTTPGLRAAEDEKPYRVSADGVVDWYTFSGFRRYHAECHVCHGPDGLGSSFAPALIDSLKTLSEDDFMEIVVNGREGIGTATQSKMPAFGENRNVMCFLTDIYAYLKARSDGAIGRGRPKKEAKPQEATESERLCLG